MGFKELSNPHHPLVVQPKVPSRAVDGWVGQLKQPVFFLHALKVNHQHLSTRDLMRPMAKGIQYGFVVLRDSNKTSIV